MRYEPAVGTLLDMLPRCRDSNTLWGIPHYLGKIHREDAHLALRESFPVLSESWLADGAASFLLEHGDPEDVPLVLDTWFRRTDPKAKKDRFSGRVLESAEASGLFEEIVEYGSCDVLTAPRGSLMELLKQHPLIHLDPPWISEVVRLIEAGRLQHLATILMLDARSKVRQRHSEHQPEGRHGELYASDMLSLAFLEEFSRRSSDLEDVMKNENVVRNIIATLLACHLSILEREAFIRALRPEATPSEMVAALKGSGKDFPSSLQDRLVELSAVQELKGALTGDLSTWGDVWTVRAMGRIGDGAFIRDLIRAVRETDGLSFVHEDAIRALSGIDDSGHEELLNAIIEEKFTNESDVLALLEHLPYAESFDVVSQLSRSGKVESSEMFGHFS